MNQLGTKAEAPSRHSFNLRAVITGHDQSFALHRLLGHNYLWSPVYPLHWLHALYPGGHDAFTPYYGSPTKQTFVSTPAISGSDVAFCLPLNPFAFAYEQRPGYGFRLHWLFFGLPLTPLVFSISTVTPCEADPTILH